MRSRWRTRSPSRSYAAMSVHVTCAAARWEAVWSVQRASRRTPQWMSASTSRRRSFVARWRRWTKPCGSFPGRPRPSCSSTALQGARGSAIRSPHARSRRSSPPSAIPRPHSRAPTRGERSGGSAVPKETGTIASSLSQSAQRSDRRDELVRRFVESARRAQIVTIVNLARSEAELGELFTAEVCEAFEAEIAFVLAARDGGAARTLVGAYGLTPDQRTDLLDDERFDEAEVALLEAVVESIKHALERIRLGEERDVLFARERAARREAEATAERLVRLESITGTILSDLPLE